MKITEIRQFEKEVLMMIKGVKLVLAEKLLQPNTLTLFSGDLFIIPSAAGKEKAVEYLLNKSVDKGPNVHCYLAGDASIDQSFLTYPYSSKKIIVHRMAVNARPLLKELLKKHPDVKISQERSPYVLFKVLNERLQKQSRTPQNSPFRRVLSFFSDRLNRIYPAKWTPNMISYHGLKKCKKGLDLLYTNQEELGLGRFVEGFIYFFIGYMTDILDGIRARYTKNNDSLKGALVDIYCDRYKEFYQLFMRANDRKKVGETEEEVQMTIDAALSSFLPSMARAWAEVQGKIVPEFDPQGGSMLSRSIRLIISLVLDRFGLSFFSKKLDRTILRKNLATFENRKKNITFGNFQKIEVKEDWSKLQRSSLHKFLLLVDLYQECYKVVKKEMKEVGGKKLSSTLLEILSVSTEEIRRRNKLEKILEIDLE